MGVKGWKLTFKVIFPAISPYVFTGIRTSIPFAVIGAIVGEFVAATEGVGFFIRMSAGIFRTADVFVGIIVLDDHGDHHGQSGRSSRAQSAALADAKRTCTNPGLTEKEILRCENKLNL